MFASEVFEDFESWGSFVNDVVILFEFCRVMNIRDSLKLVDIENKNKFSGFY